jgi:hypothetical protein
MAATLFTRSPKLKKIGITKRLRKRLRDQKLELGKNVELLATISFKAGPKIACDIERVFAEHYGYKPGTHYYEDR